MSGNRHAFPEQSLVRGPSAPEGLPAASALMFELEVLHFHCCFAAADERVQ